MILLRKIVGILVLMCVAERSPAASGEALVVSSPDGKMVVSVGLGGKISYSVSYRGRVLLAASPISIRLYDGRVIGERPALLSKKSDHVENLLQTVYGRNAEIKEDYNELYLRFKDHYSVVFRVYNEGIAYRFVTQFKEPLKIRDEEASFVFPGPCKGYYRKGNKEDYLYEAVYECSDLSKIDSGRVAIMPLLVQIPEGPKVAITESDITDYPGMYLRAEGNVLKGSFRNVPVETNVDSSQWTVSATRTADYIAETAGDRSFPWRILMVADQDKDLLNNEMVYLLARGPGRGLDFSWVRTGLIANDWWNLWWDHSPGATGFQQIILTGVDFKSGANYETYHYIIDYAEKNDIPFVNIDYGWCDPLNFSKIESKLALPRILAYAKERGRGIFLWCIAKTLYRDLEKNMELFSLWGVAGLKVDFFERDDQLGERDYQRLAECAARHHLLLEYHGATNPAGISRAYPNVLTFEAVYGSEQNNVGDQADPDHNVTMPFLRSLAGPFDYAPGSMNNVSRAHFHPFSGFPLTLGTRAHQVAMFVVYYSPLQFMCDVPSNYLREPDCLHFITRIPAAWDLSVPLDGHIGEYIVMARKKGREWFAGAMNNWDARTITLTCDFLEKGNYEVEIFRDGINADLNGNDYKIERRQLRSGEKISVDLAPGGGWVARFTPVDMR